MQFTGVLAQAVVADLATAEPWYTALFDGGPDLRPMGGLLEWHLGADAGAPYGVQVWQDADRAGRSSLVLAAEDLDVVAGRLTAAGLHPGDPLPITVGRALQLTDPDGNLVVVTGA